MSCVFSSAFGVLLLLIIVCESARIDGRSHMHVSVGGSGISFLRRPAVTDQGQTLPDDLALYACSSLDGPDCAAVKAPILQPDEKLIRLIAEALDIEELVESEAANLEALDEALYRLFGLKSRDFLGDDAFMNIDWEAILSEDYYDEDTEDYDAEEDEEQEEGFEENDDGDVWPYELELEEEEFDVSSVGFRDDSEEVEESVTGGQYHSDSLSFESRTFQLYGHLFDQDNNYTVEEKDLGVHQVDVDTEAFNDDSS
eukprot:TRINITY_DN4247_c0_g1_i1.p1 TRINITY_DN4247_c0_g1~~TRINITY_DN4247_c0_g1_i1.p1  ORF type:complete len:256 (-),score=63.53 TRINITY_DN4247_c0_g1_i1:77-844(-)